MFDKYYVINYDAIFFDVSEYNMRVLYFHIHGTTCITPFGTSLFKYTDKSLYPDLFTDEIQSLLIPLDKAPVATQNFNILFGYAQLSTSISRRIEDVFAHSAQRRPLPLGWKSHNLQIGLNDPHNNAMRKSAADRICKIVNSYLVIVDTEQQSKIINDSVNTLSMG